MTSPDCWKLLNVITSDSFFPLLSTELPQNRSARAHKHNLSLSPSPSLNRTLISCVPLPAGKLWSRSIKLAYNILHKLGSKQEPMVRPGDRVSHTRPPLQLSLFTFFFLFVLTSLQPFDTLFSQVSFFFFNLLKQIIIYLLVYLWRYAVFIIYLTKQCLYNKAPVVFPWEWRGYFTEILMPL